MTRRALSGLFVLFAASAAFAQTRATQSVASASPRPDLNAALDAWRKDHGPTWQMKVDAETGYARFVYSGMARPSFKPRNDADFLSLARTVLQETHALHGIDDATLVEDEVVFLPLGNAGSTDKITVQLRQQVAGVPVVGGYANVLFDTRGYMLSVDTTALPRLAGFDVRPSLPANEAAAVALGLFANDTGLDANDVAAPELAIEQNVRGDERTPSLVWQVDVRWSGPDASPEGYAYRIDAKSGALVTRVPLVHTFDVSGNVKSRATPGTLPDKVGNAPTLQNMPHLRVTSSQGNADTDANGNFTIVGATAPVSVTVSYDGPFTSTINNAGASYTLTQNLTLATGNNIVMNSVPAALTTAHANSFLWVNKLRDWTRMVNPADGKADFNAGSNVNINSSCNAYYNGGSINFFIAAGGCVNTAYSTVVDHELGHWMNDKYGSGNGPDGFGEGNGDNFAMYVSDQPIVGADFCGTGCGIRSGLNTVQFCGDSHPSCYGEVHADGQVIMGALWKVRSRLKTTLGASAGVVTANTLFNGWMNAYNDTQIKSIIETHWLVVDDDDGNVLNGSPHFTDIDLGFRDQGFPGVVLYPFAFANVTALANTQDETGPYVVNADVIAELHPPTTNVELFYQVNGGGFSSVPMSFVSGNTYTASIPGQSSLARVDYYISATDSIAAVNTFPAGAPGGLLQFIIGVEQVFFSDDFEVFNPVWSHGANLGNDDWAWGPPAGAGGDPTGSFDGQSQWGNDRGTGTDGMYEKNSDNWLRSPTIDLSHAVSPLLRFKRWLGVERGTKDQARVLVNGNVVWSNPLGADLIDTAWQSVEIDISAFASGDAATTLEWTITSDGGTNKGGWNIDDVEVVALSAVGEECIDPAPYCVGKLNTSALVPHLGWTGVPSATLNNFEVWLFDAVPNKAGIMFHGTAANSVPWFGGTLCVATPLKRGPQFTTDVNGFARMPIPVDNSLVGLTWFVQSWYRDPADPQTVGLSNALQIRFCE